MENILYFFLILFLNLPKLHIVKFALLLYPTFQLHYPFLLSFNYGCLTLDIDLKTK